MKLPVYLGLLHASERALSSSYRIVADGHGDEPDVHFLLLTLAGQCDEHHERLGPIVARYGESEPDDLDRMHAEGMTETRTGPLALLRDLQDLYMLASFVDVTWMMIKQAALGVRDGELLDVVDRSESEIKVHLTWLQTRMKQAAPQALIAAR